MSLADLKPVGDGLSWGLTLHKTEQDRSSIVQGVNYSLETVMEITEIGLVLEQVSRLFEALKKTQLPYFRSFLLLSAIPISLSVLLAKNFWENRTVKKATLLIHDNFGRICQLISAIVSIALIYYGQVIFGAVSLVGSASLLFFALHKLGVDKNGSYLPKIRRILDSAAFYLMIPLGLCFSSSLIVKVISAGNLIFLIGDQIFKKIKKEDGKLLEFKYPNMPREAATFQTLQDLKKRTKGVEVNSGYIYNLKLPLEKGADIQLSQLTDLSREIIPQIEPVVLEKKLIDDNRFQKIHGGEDYSHALGVQYLEEQIKIFLDKLENKGIVEGEPQNYDELIGMLKFVIFSMQTQDVVTQKDTILRLAIEGGDYCGPGVYDVLEDEMLQYQEITIPDDCTDNDLERHLLLMFRSARMRVFQGVYASAVDAQNENRKFYANYSYSFSEIKSHNGVIEKIKYIAHTLTLMLFFVFFKCSEMIVGNMLDRHIYNESSKYIGKTFNVASRGAENDTLYQSGPLDDFLLSKIFYKSKAQIEKKLLQGRVGVQTHLDALLSSSFGSSVSRIGSRKTVGCEVATKFLFPKLSFYNFWQSWIAKQAVSPEQRERFQEALQEGRVIYQFQTEDQEELSLKIDTGGVDETGYELQEDRYLLLKAMLLELGIFKISEVD